MNPNDDRRGKMIPGKSASVKEVQKLKAQMQDMQMEIDILKETLNVLKKRPRRRSDISQEQGEGSDNRHPEV